jgi:hypothetical protein
MRSMSKLAIGRGIGRARTSGSRWRERPSFFLLRLCSGNLKAKPIPRLRVGLQSTLDLSPDSSDMIDRQSVSPEPGAFDDTAGPARRVCARLLCETLRE